MTEVRALILAAGFGTRLRPITFTIPKPLVPFFGIPPLSLAIAKCFGAGINHIAINTHHLAASIEKHLSTIRCPAQIRLSHEPEILGTGGAFVPLASWRGEAPVLIYNGDIVCGVSLPDLIKRHHAERPVATMVLTREPIAGKTPVWTEGRRVLQIGGAPPSASAVARTFTGIHLVSDEFLNLTADRTGYFEILENYKISLQNHGYVMSYMYDGPWFDLGEPAAFLDAHRQGFGAAGGVLRWLDLLSFPDARNLYAPSSEWQQPLELRTLPASGQLLAHPSARVEADVKVSEWGVLGHGSHLRAHSHIGGSVVLPNAIVGESESIKHALVFLDSDCQTRVLAG